MISGLFVRFPDLLRGKWDGTSAAPTAPCDSYPVEAVLAPSFFTRLSQSHPGKKLSCLPAQTEFGTLEIILNNTVAVACHCETPIKPLGLSVVGDEHRATLSWRARLRARPSITVRPGNQLDRHTSLCGVRDDTGETMWRHLNLKRSRRPPGSAAASPRTRDRNQSRPRSTSR